MFLWLISHLYFIFSKVIQWKEHYHCFTVSCFYKEFVLFLWDHLFLSWILFLKIINLNYIVITCMSFSFCLYLKLLYIIPNILSESPFYWLLFSLKMLIFLLVFSLFPIIFKASSIAVILISYCCHKNSINLAIEEKYHTYSIILMEKRIRWSVLLAHRNPRKALGNIVFLLILMYLHEVSGTTLETLKSY